MIQPNVWDAITAVRQIGNIGAHMDQDTNLIIDVEPKEARQLIHLTEALVRMWYIQRHEEEELMRSVTSTAEQKKEQRAKAKSEKFDNGKDTPA